MENMFLKFVVIERSQKMSSKMSFWAKNSKFSSIKPSLGGGGR
jgi:hypothetical protein